MTDFYSCNQDFQCCSCKMKEENCLKMGHHSIMWFIHISAQRSIHLVSSNGNQPRSSRVHSPPALCTLYSLCCPRFHSVKCGFLSISLPSLHKLQHNWAAICVEKVQIHIFAGCARLPSNATVIVVHLSFSSIFILTVKTKKYCRSWRCVCVWGGFLVFVNDLHFNLLHLYTLITR